MQNRASTDKRFFPVLILNPKLINSYCEIVPFAGRRRANQKKRVSENSGETTAAAAVEKFAFLTQSESKKIKASSKNGTVKENIFILLCYFWARKSSLLT